MKVLVIIPCRGLEEVSDENLSALIALGYEVVSARERGYGYAIRKAMQNNPGYDVYVTTADDFATPVICLPSLVEKVAEGYDVVVGWRYWMFRASNTKARGLVSKAYNIIFGKMFATGLHEHWGDTRAFSPRFVRMVLPLTLERHFFWIPECIVAAQRCGYNVAEVPISWDKRSTPSPMSLKRLSIDAKEIFGIVRLQRRMWDFKMVRAYHSVFIKTRRIILEVVRRGMTT